MMVHQPLKYLSSLLLLLAKKGNHIAHLLEVVMRSIKVIKKELIMQP